MIYSRLYLQKRTNLVPLLAALGCTVLLLVLTVSRGSSARRSVLRTDKPARFEVVNLAPGQAGIFWESSTSEQGWIELEGPDKSVGKYYDERDLPENPGTHNYHYVALNDLKENTDYYFQIGTAKGAYAGSGGKLFHFRTPPKGIQKYDLKPAYGKVVLPSEKPASDVFVLLKIDGMGTLLAVTKSTGEWLIPLHTLVGKANNRISNGLPGTTRAQIEFAGEGKESSYVVSTLAAVNPLSSTIVLGRNYNLLAQGAVLSATSPDAVSEKSPASPLSVVYPRENALIPASRPLIKGQGIPGRDVIVFINSRPQFSFRAKVDKNSEWRVLPTDPIAAGSYVVTVTSTDEKGSKLTINRNFMIAKNGEQVLGEATASPTLVPTLTTAPTPTQAATPTGTTTPAPTATPAPTSSIPSPTPTIAVFATPTSPPSLPTIPPTPPPPTTGGNLTPMLFMSVAFVVVGAGLMLVF